MFRSATFNTYDQNYGWVFNNNAALTGGVNPSSWTDGNATANMISLTPQSLAALFTDRRHAGNNAMVVSDTDEYYSSTNGQMTAALFQVENTTDHAIDWNVSYYFTAYAGWNEFSSLAVNGQLVRADSQTGSAFATLSLPAHQVSHIIAVAGAGSPAGNMRSNELGFYNNSLELPGGLRFVDQLLDVQPVPEPESYAMLLAGLGLMGVVARRRRTLS